MTLTLGLPGTHVRQPRLTIVYRDMRPSTRYAPQAPLSVKVCSIYWIGTGGKTATASLLNPWVDYSPQWAVTSILLYGCTTWTLTKWLEKKLDGNYTRMLRAILNRSWQQHPTRHQLYGHLPPITKTIQVRRTRHAGHCWRSRDELIRDVLLWIPTHGRAKAGRPARTYIQQLCGDTGCCPEDLPRAMNDREEWRERVRDIRAASAIWWWWWYWKSPLCIEIGMIPQQ